MQSINKNNYQNEDLKLKDTIVYINTCLYGSTGKIVKSLKKAARDKGYDVWTVTSYDRNYSEYSENDIVIGNQLDRYLHLLLSRLLGMGGMFSILSTFHLISRLKTIDPDIIHIHNLHNSYINIPLLFNYIADNNIKVIWTLHDCWSFTGRCPYFDITECSKWKSGCKKCPFPSNEYPVSYIDRADWMWKIKKHYFNKPERMVIVTPSQWLSDLLGASFLKTYPRYVIHNGIDLSVFKPTNNSLTVTSHGSDRKKTILGVALSWDRRKGLDVFIKLANVLDSEKYQIILVGMDNNNNSKVPESIICIDRTSSQMELAQLYSQADVFVNPTREDNFPTVNIEALACGTPVVCFNTGGCPEAIDSSCGRVVDKNDFNALLSAIIELSEDKQKYSEACRIKALDFNSERQFDKYFTIFD